ncbi:hypothetical protein FXF51_55625 [Nonomuraea sp. PA05]|uniref:hypothetical protein n=1 Tax=Nonomuraea sp. PA05 TaxID=2604466 RepID=UPI0011D70AA5|nr:hypothetical protein [Nonomuraea sp. PA05]TYB50627.1 hypothetical protein FXF51_55625 [Nonomuraea sp. PA05]
MRVVRMAFGVVTGRDQQVLDAHGRLVADESEAAGAGAPGFAAAGAAVAAGPAGADPRPAVAALARYLHGDGGTLTAAGAGIALSPGFVTARLHGARGDRRDAVLAAVQLLGLDGLHRLGERAGVLVALFGAEATKPLAAAAGQAIAERRWAALQLASAASGVLGAEQLVRLLTLDGPPIDPTPDAAASTMAAHLGQLLAPYSGKRRLDLLLDLWQRVAARQERLRRDQRRRATQGKRSRLDELTARYRSHDDALLLDQIRQELGHEPTVAEAARWFPYAWQAEVSLNRTLADALAATALVRTAVNVGDHGVVQGMNRSTALLTAAARAISQEEARAAARRVPGLTGLPARPGCYVRDLAAQLGNPAEQYVRQRLARAAEYAEILLDVATDRLIEFRNQLGGWPSISMRDWRAGVGYLTGRDPARWAQPPVGDGRPPLAERLEARPGVPAAEEETAGDLFWYAELADALAQLNGHEQADVEYGAHYPYIDHDPVPDDDRQLVPSLDSLPAALAGAAQLVSFGGPPPRQCRTWPDLTDRLLAALGVTQRLTTAFRVPEPLLALDGTVLPGTEVRLRFARDARALTRWATYMGNCIASLPYVEAAEQGESALVALHDEDGRIVVNVKLDQHVRGWRVGEMRARFNADPDLELRRSVVAWAAALPSAIVEEPAADPEGERLPAARPTFRRRVDRTFQEVSGPLARLAADALAAEETVDALRVLHGSGGAPPAEALTSLRRLSADRVQRLSRNKLQAVGLPALWRATSARPLERALIALPSARAPEDAGGRPQLSLLLLDAPLPGSLRKLARHDAIAPARSMELVARRIRAAIGRLARAGDPALAHQVARRADTAVLCSLVVAVTSWPPDPALPTVAVSEPGRTCVPGFPRSDLDDPSGPWQRALPGAVELGADLDAFRERVAGEGLHVPVAWLGHGGWNALWQRAAR